MVEDRPASARHALAGLEAALRSAPEAITASKIRKVAITPDTVRMFNYALIALILGAVVFGALSSEEKHIPPGTGESESFGGAEVSTQSGGLVPLKLVGSAGLKPRLGYSHISAMGLDKPYYSTSNQVTWTGSAAFTITNAYVALLDKNGQEIDRFDARTTSMGASLQPGDSITLTSQRSRRSSMNCACGITCQGPSDYRNERSWHPDRDRSLARYWAKDTKKAQFEMLKGAPRFLCVVGKMASYTTRIVGSMLRLCAVARGPQSIGLSSPYER